MAARKEVIIEFNEFDKHDVVDNEKVTKMLMNSINMMLYTQNSAGNP